MTFHYLLMANQAIYQRRLMEILKDTELTPGQPKVLDYLGKAKSRTAIVQIAELEKTLDNFKLDVGRYPTTEEGLDALVKRPASANLWSGPYIKEVPKDPWNNPYKYANPGAGGGVEILSLGADGVAGGDGENADIRNKP